MGKQEDKPSAACLTCDPFGACCDYLGGSVPYALTVWLLITQNHLVTATAAEVCYCPASTDHRSGFGTGVKHIGWLAERNLHSHSKCCRNRLLSASVITYEDLAPRVQLASYWQTGDRKQSGLSWEGIFWTWQDWEVSPGRAGMKLPRNNRLVWPWQLFLCTIGIFVCWGTSTNIDTFIVDVGFFYVTKDLEVLIIRNCPIGVFRIKTIMLIHPCVCRVQCAVGRDTWIKNSCRNRCCCNWLGRLTSQWLNKGKLPRGILGTNCRMCQVILVSLDRVETAVCCWTVWIGTWERRELFGSLLWDFCKHMWRLTENCMFGVFLWISREICDDMWVEKNMKVLAEICEWRFLPRKVTQVGSTRHAEFVKISENSVKNLEILLNISRFFCKLVGLGSLMCRPCEGRWARVRGRRGSSQGQACSGSLGRRSWVAPWSVGPVAGVGNVWPQRFLQEVEVHQRT